MKDYFRQTQTATYSYLAALPLLIAYEVLILAANTGARTPIRVGADLWLKQVLVLMGGASHLALGVVVAIVGLIVFAVDRRKDLTIRGRYFGYMLVESIVYAIVVAVFVSALTQRLFHPAAWAQAPLLAQEAGGDSGGLMLNVALSIGAGLYEELVFRVLLVGLLFLVFHKLTRQKGTAYFAAVLLAAVVFSGVHHLGPFGDPFAWDVFFFRFLFGLALNALYVSRGFGIAAWTHALYDLLVVTAMFFQSMS